MAKRKKSKVRAQPLFLEDLTKWEKRFRTRVAKIAPGMVRAETGRMLRETNVLHAAHPGAISDSFHEQYKASMKDLVEAQQMSIAEGRIFREFFANIEPLALDAYLGTQAMTAAWMVGFSNDGAVLRRYEKEVRKGRKAALRPMQLAGAQANISKWDNKALDAANEWRNDPVRRSRLSSLSRVAAVQSYLRGGRPLRRQANRLRAMLADGRIK